MRAAVYHGPRDVRIDEKPKPQLQEKEDSILRVTAICGSDLHLYHGTVPKMEPGQTLGHEFMGVIEEVGPEVHDVKIGDRVVIPFNIGCGRCWACTHQLWSACERSNPTGKPGSAYGYSQSMGGFDGGQAELVRIPFANTNPQKVPDALSDEQVLFLSEVFPTGYFGTDIAGRTGDVAGVRPGDDVVVFGAGPVGYFAALSALKLRGRRASLSSTHFENRLKLMKDLGASVINFDEEDPVDVVKRETGGKGAICIDAVGYEAVGHHDHGQVQDPAYEPNNPVQILQWASKCAAPGSAMGIPGVYVSAYDNFPFGDIFDRGLQLRMGQCPVKKYNEALMPLIESDRVDTTKLISHRMKLDEAPEAYELWDKKSGATKIVMTP